MVDQVRTPCFTCSEEGYIVDPVSREHINCPKCFGTGWIWVDDEVYPDEVLNIPDVLPTDK
jgi:hypothetical protein